MLIRRINKLGKDAGINFEITLYIIRRKSGTLRQDKFSEFFAGDLKIVQRMFNHKHVKTTLRFNQRTDHDVEKYLQSIYNSKDMGYNRKETVYNEGL